MTVPAFRRLILELGLGASGIAAMREAAGVAKSLGLDLVAVFVEDEALLHASGLSFSREIDPVTHRWRPLETGRLESELRAAAARARDQLAAAAKAAGVVESFEVHRGDPGPWVADICIATDIVAVSVGAMGGATHGFRRLTDTAHGSAASVLWLPAAPGPAHGPIVAAAADMSDPCIAVARGIADRAGERLLIAMPNGGAYPVAGETADDLANALDDARERLIAISRTGPFGQAGAALSARRGVPVLVLE